MASEVKSISGLKPFVRAIVQVTIKKNSRELAR
jgi:hypothetical protein